MATQVQWRRGTHAQVLAFTGAVGEIVVDLTQNRLVLQDGVTAGGWPHALLSNETYINATLGGTTAAVAAPTVSVTSTVWGYSAAITVNYSGGATFTGTETHTGTSNFTGGTITVPTKNPGDNSTNAASTAYVAAAIVSVQLPGNIQYMYYNNGGL